MEIFNDLFSDPLLPLRLELQKLELKMREYGLNENELARYYELKERDLLDYHPDTQIDDSP